MSSCIFHPVRPAVSTIEGRLLCAQCDRDWHSQGYFPVTAPVAVAQPGSNAQTLPPANVSSLLHPLTDSAGEQHDHHA